MQSYFKLPENQKFTFSYKIYLYAINKYIINLLSAKHQMHPDLLLFKNFLIEKSSRITGAIQKLENSKKYLHI